MSDIDEKVVLADLQGVYDTFAEVAPIGVDPSTWSLESTETFVEAARQVLRDTEALVARFESAGADPNRVLGDEEVRTPYQAAVVIVEELAIVLSDREGPVDIESLSDAAEECMQAVNSLALHADLPKPFGM